MTPGDNLLEDALDLIASQDVELYRFASRAKTPAGVMVATYSGPVYVQGSVQAVDRKHYEQMGLDFARTYVKFYTSEEVRNVQRDQTGDLFTYAGRWYQAESQTSWLSQDGWNDVLAVMVPAPDASSRNSGVPAPS